MQERKYIHIKARPFVSIITLNWNQTEITCQLLESARKLQYKPFEILVCDMGSVSDPTPQITGGNYPNTHVLKIDRYRDTGINAVIKQAKGDFILLINNHIEFTENTLDDLIAPFLNDHFLGIVCPKIRSYHKRNEIQYAGYNTLNILTGRKSIVGYGKTDRGQYDTPLYTHGACSGAMLFKKSVIEKAGMLPRNFFVYFDDMDISERILRKGYRILYQPKAVVYHKDSLLPSEKQAMNVYYNTRNRILFMRKNRNLFQFSVFITTFLIFILPFTAFKFLLMGQFRHLCFFFEGIWWNLKMRESR
ncbi:MAG: glycosyltransferase family 2 protein [Chitinophagaceae bacterium]|nr:glycosyltransferase family 2 protein [Chitinophagaceae bacterium]